VAALTTPFGCGIRLLPGSSQPGRGRYSPEGSPAADVYNAFPALLLTLSTPSCWLRLAFILHAPPHFTNRRYVHLSSLRYTGVNAYSEFYANAGLAAGGRTHSSRCVLVGRTVWLGGQATAVHACTFCPPLQG